MGAAHGHAWCVLVLHCALYFLKVSETAPSDGLDIMYSILFPVAWGAGMGLFTWSALDRALPGQEFFELSCFGPLAKLGLSVYLVHEMILFVRAADMIRNPYYSFWRLIDNWLR